MNELKNLLNNRDETHGLYDFRSENNASDQMPANTADADRINHISLSVRIKGSFQCKRLVARNLPIPFKNRREAKAKQSRYFDV